MKPYYKLKYAVAEVQEETLNQKLLSPWGGAELVKLKLKAKIKEGYQATKGSETRIIKEWCKQIKEPDIKSQALAELHATAATIRTRRPLDPYAEQDTIIGERLRLRSRVDNTYRFVTLTDEGLVLGANRTRTTVEPASNDEARALRDWLTEWLGESATKITETTEIDL